MALVASDGSEPHTGQNWASGGTGRDCVVTSFCSTTAWTSATSFGTHLILSDSDCLTSMSILSCVVRIWIESSSILASRCSSRIRSNCSLYVRSCSTIFRLADTSSSRDVMSWACSVICDLVFISSLVRISSSAALRLPTCLASTRNLVVCRCCSFSSSSDTRRLTSSSSFDAETEDMDCRREPAISFPSFPF